MSACEVKDPSGPMIRTACAEVVLIEKLERGVVIVIAAEEYERQIGKA